MSLQTDEPFDLLHHRLKVALQIVTGEHARR
jgi:hypothetical protein